MTSDPSPQVRIRATRALLLLHGMQPAPLELVTSRIFRPKGQNMLVLTYFPNGIFRSCWPRNWYSHQRLNAETALEADAIRLLNLYSLPDYGFFLYFRPNYAFSDCIEISLY